MEDIDAKIGGGRTELGKLGISQHGHEKGDMFGDEIDKAWEWCTDAVKVLSQNF